MLKNYRILPNEAFNYLNAFCNAIGIDTAKSLYGENWPRKLVEGEIFYLFQENNQRVGWSMVRQDLVEPYIHMVLGVWPEYQNNGYSKLISRLTVKNALRMFPEAKGVMFAISRNNGYFLYSLLKKVRKESKTKFAGYINYPEPGYYYFWIDRKMVRLEDT